MKQYVYTRAFFPLRSLAIASILSVSPFVIATEFSNSEPIFVAPSESRAFAASAFDQLSDDFPILDTLETLPSARREAVLKIFENSAKSFPPCGHDTPLQRQAEILRIRLDLDVALRRPMYEERQPGAVREQIYAITEAVDQALQVHFQGLGKIDAFDFKVLSPALLQLRARLEDLANSPFDPAMDQPLPESVLNSLIAHLCEEVTSMEIPEAWSEQLFLLPGEGSATESIKTRQVAHAAGVKISAQIRSWQSTVRETYLGTKRTLPADFGFDQKLLKESLPVQEAASIECDTLTAAQVEAEMVHLVTVQNAMAIAAGVAE